MNKKNEYLIIDACLGGTGIRDCYESGYLYPEDLFISNQIINILNEWLLQYSEQHYKGFNDVEVVEMLDNIGIKIALIIKNELSLSKIEYYSDALMTKTLLF